MSCEHVLHHISLRNRELGRYCSRQAQLCVAVLGGSSAPCSPRWRAGGIPVARRLITNPWPNTLLSPPACSFGVLMHEVRSQDVLPAVWRRLALHGLSACSLVKGGPGSGSTVDPVTDARHEVCMFVLQPRQDRASCTGCLISVAWLPPSVPQIITGERPMRGSMRMPHVPEECPQVCAAPAGLSQCGVLRHAQA